MPQFQLGSTSKSNFRLITSLHKLVIAIGFRQFYFFSNYFKSNNSNIQKITFVYNSKLRLIASFDIFITQPCFVETRNFSLFSTQRPRIDNLK